MMPKRWWIIDSIIVVLLLFISGIWFTWHHAYGAYGDDSPGYIYLAHQLLSGGDLVQQDPLVKQALDYFGSEPYARFVAPAHHEIISPEGWTASRYPIGLSVLMALAAAITGNTTAIYLVVPMAAVLIVLFTYLGAIWLLPVSAVQKRLVGLGSACIVIGCDLFANYAVAQPMREIPSMVFSLAAFYLLVWALQQKRKRYWFGLILSALAFAFSVGIRETSVILIIPFLVYAGQVTKQAPYQQRLYSIGIFLFGCLLGYSIFIVQAVDITLHKAVFRAKDVSRIAVTSNFDHIQSLAIHNLWDNQGKFKPGVGGLNQYWDVLQQFSPWILFLPFLFVGLIYCWQRHRLWFWTFGSWCVAVVLLFGMWINPYPRYILPILPLVAWLSMLGAFYSWELLTTKFTLRRLTSISILLLLGISFVVAYQPTFAAQQLRLSTGTTIDRELTKSDLDTLQVAMRNIEQDAESTGKLPLLIMLGSTKGGLAETLLTHSNVKTIRFPNKDKEQPPYELLTAFLDQLGQTYTLYLWYDPTVTALEQRFYNEQELTLVTATATSFQSAINLYRITQ